MAWVLLPASLAIGSALIVSSPAAATVTAAETSAVAWANSEIGTYVSPEGVDWFDACLPFVQDAYLDGTGPFINIQNLVQPDGGWNGQTDPQKVWAGIQAGNYSAGTVGNAPDPNPPFGSLVFFDATGTHDPEFFSHVEIMGADGVMIGTPGEAGQAVFPETLKQHEAAGDFNAYVGWWLPDGSGGPTGTGSGATITQVTSSQNPSSFGQSVTFTSTVTPTSSSSSQPSGTVQFFDDGTLLGTESTGSPSSDQASLTVSNLVGGTQSITAQYGGNSNFTGSTSGTYDQVVNPLSTTTTVSGTPSPALIGQPVTYTASVSPIPDGGTVAFTDNGGPICGSVSVNTSTGQAACPVTYTAAQAGIHTVTAAFSGDADYAYSLSNALDEDVQIPTTTAVASSANPSVPQEPVVFSATVSPVPDGGTVGFTDNGTPVSGCGAESVSATSGIATCPLTFTADGTYNVVAAYSGDDLYAPSQGGPLVQSVVPIVVTVSPNPEVETGNSEVYTVIQVRADPKYAGSWVLISSSELASSCGAVWYGYLPAATTASLDTQRNQILAPVDQDGNATLVLAGDKCVPGASVLTAQLEASPFPNANSGLPNASATLDVEPPGGSSPGVTAVPSSEVETGNNSAVSVVFEIHSTSAQAGEAVTISSPQLTALCPRWAWGSTSQVDYGNRSSSYAMSDSLEKNGDDVFTFEGIGCANGTATVTAVVAGTPYTTQFTVLPPQP
jgi:hypothetical protein